MAIASDICVAFLFQGGYILKGFHHIFHSFVVLSLKGLSCGSQHLDILVKDSHFPEAVVLCTDIDQAVCVGTMRLKDCLKNLYYYPAAVLVC